LADEERLRDANVGKTARRRADGETYGFATAVIITRFR
jgi:hypothetical protein